MVSRVPSTATSTGCGGSARLISASSRPETSACPAVPAVTSSSTSVEASRSNPETVSTSCSTVSSRPASTGTVGRADRLRAAQATASASASRSTRNFILPPVRYVRTVTCVSGTTDLRVGGRGFSPDQARPDCSGDSSCEVVLLGFVFASVESGDNRRHASVCGRQRCGRPRGRRVTGRRHGSGRRAAPPGMSTPLPRPSTCDEAVLGDSGAVRRDSSNSRVSRAGPHLDAAGQLGDLVVDGELLGHLGADLAIGVHDRRVVAAAELLADLRQ